MDSLLGKNQKVLLIMMDNGIYIVWRHSSFIKNNDGDKAVLAERDSYPYFRHVAKVSFCEI
jgi:hypothetical protein